MLEERCRSGQAELFVLYTDWSPRGTSAITALLKAIPTTFGPTSSFLKDRRRLILDAKYKGQKGGFYGDEAQDGTIRSWRDKDIDKMHAYREAIRKVSGAFILYPGTATAIYPSHGSKNLCEGVGALPLKPIAGAKPDPRHVENIVRVLNDFLS